MAKKRMPIKHNPGRNDSVPTLPGMGVIKKTPEMKAEEYLSGIMSNGFIDKHKLYLENYINSDLSIALSHIKSAYKTYVAEGSWSDNKFDKVIEELIQRRWMLTTKSFMNLGIDFDQGKLVKSINPPQYGGFGNSEPQQEISDEELFELLKNNF